MANGALTFSRLDAKRREQTPQALARLALLLLFMSLWGLLWLLRIPMPFPFLLLLFTDALFLIAYWRVVSLLPNVRSIEVAHYVMLGADIVFYTSMVYFLGGVSWQGSSAYVFGLIFSNAFLDLRRGLVYTAGATLAFAALIVLEATGAIPHYVYLEQGPLRYTDTPFVATTIIGAAGVFFSIYAWVNWVGYQLRRERDAAIRAQDGLLRARAALQLANEELEERVRQRTGDLESANVALRESEQRLHLVLETCPDLISIQEPNGRYRFVNSAFRTVLGYEPDQLIGKNPAELAHPDDLEEVSERFRTMVGSGRPAEATFRFRHADGHWMTVEANGRVLVDDAGEATGVVVVSRDVTERKRAEEALRESEERVRTLIENVDAIVWEADATTWQFTFVSRQAEQILGYPVEQWISEPKFWANHIHPDDREYAVALCAKATAEGNDHEFDYRMVARDGRPVWLHDVVRVITDGQGTPRQLRGIMIDITERKRAEEALRESEERYRSLAENTFDLVCETGADARFSYLSPNYKEVLGYAPEELLGTSIFDLIHADDRPAVATEFGRALRTRTAGQAVFRYRHKNGEWRWFESAGRPFQTQSGELRAVIISRDITERKQSEEALRESEGTLKATIESTADGILVVHEDGNVAYANARFAEMWRIPETLLQTRDDKLLAFVLDQLQDPQVFLSKVRELYQSSAEDLDTLLFKDGRVFERYSRPLIRAGEAAGRVWSFRDITERKRAEEALRDQARRDPLTALLNHAAIVEELRRLIATDGARLSHAVAMVDVDGLKAVNDTYGHQVGDAVLLAVAQALARDGALVGRYGGDEFVAVLRDSDRTAAERYRALVLDALAGAGITDAETGTNVPVVASIGLAIYPEEAETIEDLIRLSDSAMYAWRRQRPVIPGELRSAGRLASDRAAQMIGELVPLLTSPSQLSDKLRLVAQQLSVGAGYDGVNFSLFSDEPGAPLAGSTFARVPEELVETWRDDQSPGRHERHPIRVLFERVPRPVIMDDPWNDERLYPSQRELLRAAGLRSVLVVPMIWQDRAVGSLGVASKQEAAFTPLDAQFLTAVATQVTAIVRMATLVEELHASASRRAQAQDETVLLLAAAAEAHDQTTGRHLQGVRALTEALARELGHSEEEARELGLAAVLHDIGKIRVPEAVLAHTGQLAEEEWELMKHHTTWGAQFLAGRPGFELAATIARSHHERWDGSGYPHGLAGDAIPEAAAVVAVADSFDAMITDRPYRRGRSVAQAVREIVSCSGKQFSPTVVAALLRLHRSKRLPVAARPSSRRAA